MWRLAARSLDNAEVGLDLFPLARSFFADGKKRHA